ncbi:YaiI/YqxD family protein [Chitinibacteraceae bacterium HSL-7]
MTIWVDADACPRVVRDVLYRAAERTGTALVLVANQLISVPRSQWIRALQVEAGFDVADAEIVRRVQPGELVITADLPLAAQVIDAGGAVITPRGELLTPNCIRERLSLRDFSQGLRDAGIDTGGPASMSAADTRQFAAALDRWLAKRPRT